MRRPLHTHAAYFRIAHSSAYAKRVVRRIVLISIPSAVNPWPPVKVGKTDRNRQPRNNRLNIFKFIAIETLLFFRWISSEINRPAKRGYRFSLPPRAR